MKKLAKIVDEKLHTVNVALGDNIEFYKSIGFINLDVEQGYNGNWYIQGYAPAKPEPTLEEILIQKEQEYNMPRVIREGILGNPTAYSEFNVNRAKELEELAKTIRNLKAGK